MTEEGRLPRVNLHTHTSRCKHASGTMREYCREAIRQGIGILGFSDHSPFPDEKYDSSRMKFGELEAYCADVAAMREEFPELRLLTGLEIDYRPELGKAFYEDEYLGRLGMDYLIGGAHFAKNARGEDIYIGTGQGDRSQFGCFVKQTIEMIESGLLSYVTHPDLMAMLCDRWTAETEAGFRAVIECAKGNGVPLEINAYGLRKPKIATSEGLRAGYPWAPVWRLAGELDVDVTIGADAHRPQDVWGNADDCVQIAEANGLRVVNRAVAEKLLHKKP